MRKMCSLWFQSPTLHLEVRAGRCPSLHSSGLDGLDSRAEEGAAVACLWVWQKVRNLIQAGKEQGARGERGVTRPSPSSCWYKQQEVKALLLLPRPLPAPFSQHTEHPRAPHWTPLCEISSWGGHLPRTVATQSRAAFLFPERWTEAKLLACQALLSRVSFHPQQEAGECVS